jgi:hypothetical protein
VPEVDARILRLQQGVVAVILLAGFVFQVQWMIPAAAVLPGLDAALGGAGPTRRFWAALVAPRLDSPRTLESPDIGRTQSLIEFFTLIVATLLVLAGISLLAALLAFLVAGVCAACATGLFCVGAEVDRRMGGPRRRNRPKGSRDPDL